uniref:Uncharacterized protein n=1 Tax=Fagus sylvatica TaxID=28930 RepID=A0A2N9FVD4_FAGSY
MKKNSFPRYAADFKASSLQKRLGPHYCPLVTVDTISSPSTANPAVHRKYLRKNICGSISWKSELMEKARQATYQSDAALFIVFPKRPAQSSMAETPHCPVVTADTATKRSTAAPDVTRNHEKKAGPSLCPLVADGLRHEMICGGAS